MSAAASMAVRSHVACMRILGTGYGAAS